MADDSNQDGREAGRDSGKESGRDSGLTETLKRLLVSGISGALLTEDMIRSYLQDLKIPKDVLQMFIQAASKQKDDMQQKVTREISGLLKKIDWVSEVSRFAETHKFKITAEIEILKKAKEESEVSKTPKEKLD